MYSLSTSGRGRRQTRSSARLARLTRTSLYSKYVPGSSKLARGSLLGLGPRDAQVAVAVDAVRFAPEGAFPLAGLLQQVLPGDLAVVRRFETAIIDHFADRRLNVRDQPPVESQTRAQGQIALGCTEGHIRPVDITPRRYQAPAPQDQAVGSAAGLEWTDDFVVRRRFGHLGHQGGADIAGPIGLAGDGKRRPPSGGAPG